MKDMKTVSREDLLDQLMRRLRERVCAKARPIGGSRELERARVDALFEAVAEIQLEITELREVLRAGGLS